MTVTAQVPACVGAFLLAAVAGGSAVAQHHDTHDARALREDPRLAPGQLAPELAGLGDHHFAITTDSERAQRFFDQGLSLTYGFNHQEALRAFKEAARLDPGCAMAYWGWALVLGPNLNLPMRPSVVAQAHEAIGMALARRAGASEKERLLIEALAERYTNDAEADRGTLDAAYASAMSGVYAKYPEDTDVGTLYAASLMNLAPWNYWTPDGRPRANTETLLAVLERVIERDPHHEGALHYYIHAVEPVDPERGTSAADALRGLAPGIGHLEHMPSHIYMRVGRYAESVAANQRAAAADEDYVVQCRAQGIYPLNYYPHNVHFLAWAAIMQGRSTLALEAARKIAAGVPDDMHGDDWGLFQTFLSMPLYTMVRFGMWDAILAEARPADSTAYFLGIWHYARGMAYARSGSASGSRKKARRELAALRAILADPTTVDFIGFSNAPALLTIAQHVLAGEVAATARRWDEAVGQLDRAVRLEDALLYNEPPDWYYPVRHTLGAVLLDAGRPIEAEVVYWQDLRRNEDNGYALLGLAQAQAAQGRDDEAAATRERFHTAWSAADMQLESSRH